MNSRQTALVVTVAAVLLLLAACSSVGSGGVDMRPVGHGLEFLGLAGVLAALIIVFGRFLGR